ncbi:uncharacterized protein METZ01_LOCUS257263 [marine metagenome]|uniref:TnsA endonuclease N-terminal domain-containing protein n=1 Tax=marine metagenome TaxID=408172 RepID=A0A382IYI8_9ZZZZ
MYKTYKGIYKPKNLHKYKGNPSNIIYRSSWERKFMMYCDNNINILEWSSEEVTIPYRCPTDGKKHRYFPDFLIMLRTQNGIETQLIEIKPYRQLFKPKKSGKRYLTEMKAWTKNQAKFEAASKFCTRRNWKFQIITEKEMGL